MSASTPQSPEPKGAVIDITSLDQFQTEISRSDIVTCVLAFTTYCNLSSSDNVYDGFSALSGEAEFQTKVQFLRVDVAEVQEVTKAMSVFALPLIQIFWEGNRLQQVQGANVDKFRLAVRHAYQAKYIALLEREKAERDRKIIEEGGVPQPSATAPAAKAGVKSGSKPSTPVSTVRRSSSKGK
eukprot:GILI01027133.1.p1 GENE.GILI01027133.1~~GILI01027133.1.p1  ORF type:complete len:183 (+),score=29.66 GILI01027133.1:75-623(+)